MNRLILLSVAALALLGGCAITPIPARQHSTFEGFPVISYVPEHPRGMVYMFHGSNGSANFAEKVETTDVLNRLIARGYGFVSTSSTERTGNKRWNAADPSLTSNPDLARLVRLQANLVATTGLETNTPLVGIGMSNGARFVTLWGQSWKNAGYPVKAIWASHGTTASPYDGRGQLTVPTFFTTAENDFTSPPGGVIKSFVTASNSGTPSELNISRERRLSSVQYERIAGIDAEEGKQIFFSLVATGAWNGQGDRVEPEVEQAAAKGLAANMPASMRSVRNEIDSETLLQLAVHQFTAEFAEKAIAFFNRYVP
jgi:hypothetical protein